MVQRSVKVARTVSFCLFHHYLPQHANNQT